MQKLMHFHVEISNCKYSNAGKAYRNRQSLVLDLIRFSNKF